MKTLPLLGALLLVGCAKTVATRPGYVISIRQMIPKEMEDLTQKGLPHDPQAVLLTEPFSLMGALCGQGYAVEAAVLRNPGVEVCIVRKHSDGTPLTERDREALKEIAEERENVTIWPSLRVLPVFGPDGKTRKILPNLETAASANGSVPKIGPVTTTLIFPSEAKAKEAAKYIDPAYKVKISNEEGGWVLAATIELNYLLADDEQFEFEPLAKRFGGTVDGVAHEM